MYFLALGINCIIILFISYLCVFDRKQLATGVNQWAGHLAIAAMAGLCGFTGVSAFYMFQKQMAGFAWLLLSFSWLFILYCGYRFVASQKWM